MDPVALAKEGQLSPSAGDRAEPSVTWQRAHQALRLAAAGEFAAVQDVDGVLGDRNAGGNWSGTPDDGLSSFRPQMASRDVPG